MNVNGGLIDARLIVKHLHLAGSKFKGCFSVDTSGGANHVHINQERPDGQNERRERDREQRERDRERCRRDHKRRDREQREREYERQR
jgi:hypothetical protein